MYGGWRGGGECKCAQLMEGDRLLEAIQQAVRRGEHGFTLHATSQTTSEGIPLSEVEAAICSLTAELIEDYPEDPRGPSCLLLGYASIGDPPHVVCSHPPNVAIITVYRPDPDRWADYRLRR